MGRLPWFPLYVDIIQQDHRCKRMTDEEFGFYVRTLLVSWGEEEQGTLPSSLAEVSAILGRNLRRTSRMFGGLIGECWPEINGRRENKKLMEVAEKQRKRSSHGRAGAAARWPNRPMPEHTPGISPSDGSIDIEIDIDKKKKKILKEKAGEYSIFFLDFWAAYPRKIGKPTAWRSWRKVFAPSWPESRVRPDDIINAVNAQIMAGMLDGGKFTPHPSSWLNGERWNDPIQQQSRNISQTTQNILDSDIAEHDDTGGGFPADKGFP